MGVKGGVHWMKITKRWYQGWGDSCGWILSEGRPASPGIKTGDWGIWVDGKSEHTTRVGEGLSQLTPGFLLKLGHADLSRMWPRSRPCQEQPDWSLVKKSVFSKPNNETRKKKLIFPCFKIILFSTQKMQQDQ